ncbi:MAG: PTS sugar transporter subunit IIA [Candidatus Aminicenantes bacterium]|nr:MAG: PTS sugar transporter subunit IIA [Candidatus Aminicenantes bacterium]
MDLKAILKKELTFFSNLVKKKDNLEALIRLIENENLIEDVDLLRRSIFSREELMSTGLGLGIAVPHARIKGVENIIIAIGINKNAIDDYESLDGTPVRIVIMIVAGEKQHREYLMLLSQMVKILKKNSMIDNLLEAEKAEEVIGLISEDFNNNHPTENPS